MISRETIYAALFALVSQGEGMAGTISWGARETLAYTSRRVRLWTDIPAQPALCQAEHDETVVQQTRLPFRRKFGASWLIYHADGADPNATPASSNNAILDAIEALFTPQPPDPGWNDNRLTLGGLVHHCWIDGRILKDPGDLDSQALIVVPISILAP
jgi:hypothetical protein